MLPVRLHLLFFFTKEFEVLNEGGYNKVVAKLLREFFKSVGGRCVNSPQGTGPEGGVYAPPPPKKMEQLITICCSCPPVEIVKLSIFRL